MVLSLGSILGFNIATADVKGFYKQSGSSERDIFVRTHGYMRDPRRKIWKLNKKPYGIDDSGRQWLCVVEDWIHSYRLSQVFGILQLFCERDADGQIILLIAKVVDEFLIIGKRHDLTPFLEALEKRFELGAV